MKEIPSDLHDMLVEQTQGCDAVIDEKNKLIHLMQLVKSDYLIFVNTVAPYLKNLLRLTLLRLHWFGL